MPTHGSVAKAVRMAKEKRPEQFCRVQTCLWRTDEIYCPNHKPPPRGIPRGGRHNYTGD